LAEDREASEQRILGELGRLSDKLRAARAAPSIDAPEVQSIESQMSLKWQQLRLLRAGPINAQPNAPFRRNSHA
jgi:hypothetical protein